MLGSQARFQSVRVRTRDMLQLCTTTYHALYCATVMAKCPLCTHRSAKRFCPAKAVRICSICCGTKREIEIDCPSDCSYLQAGRRYEVRQGPTGKPPQREFSQQFRHRCGGAITVLAQSVLAERSENPSLLDSDVRAAFEALQATMKTLEAGIHYETLPEGSAGAMGLYRRVQPLIDLMMKPQGVAYDALRAGDVPEVLDFIIVSADLHSGGRPKSRRYLDWLSSVAPVPAADNPDSLILP